MRYEADFTLSHSPFAVSMGRIAREHREPGWVDCEVDAVWYVRRKGVLRACAGTLHGLFGHGTGIPLTAEDFVLLADRQNTRASATCLARWDGSTFWAAPPMEPHAQREYLELLEPVLGAFPEAPDGYHGWWRFADVF